MKDIDSEGLGLLMVSFTPLFYIILEYIFYSNGWSAIWVLILSGFVFIPLSVFILYKVDEYNDKKK